MPFLYSMLTLLLFSIVTHRNAERIRMKEVRGTYDNRCCLWPWTGNVPPFPHFVDGPRLIHNGSFYFVWTLQNLPLSFTLHRRYWENTIWIMPWSWMEIPFCICKIGFSCSFSFATPTLGQGHGGRGSTSQGVLAATPQSSRFDSFGIVLGRTIRRSPFVFGWTMLLYDLGSLSGRGQRSQCRSDQNCSRGIFGRTRRSWCVEYDVSIPHSHSLVYHLQKPTILGISRQGTTAMGTNPQTGGSTHERRIVRGQTLAPLPGRVVTTTAGNCNTANWPRGAINFFVSA